MKEQSPVFFVFVECVSDLVKQNPLSFEFGQELLLYLAFQCYIKQTGTFLFDCECDRNIQQVGLLTNSVFDDWDQWKTQEI